jgi:hypothetical protein
VAFVLTVAFGSTKRVALAGFLLAVAWLVVGYVVTPTEAAFALFVEGLALAGWLAGVGLGAAIRRSEAVEVPRVRRPGSDEDVDRGR